MYCRLPNITKSARILLRRNAEWDLLSINTRLNEQLYPGCCGAEFYVDMVFTVTVRRKPLFYTVNLVIPCMLIGSTALWHIARAT